MACSIITYGIVRTNLSDQTTKAARDHKYGLLSAFASFSIATWTQQVLGDDVVEAEGQPGDHEEMGAHAQHALWYHRFSQRGCQLLEQNEQMNMESRLAHLVPNARGHP